MSKVLPKYSYLLLNKDRPDLGESMIGDWYGNVVAVFKDKVKTRSTFTNGDSLNIGATHHDTKTFYYRPKKILVNQGHSTYWEAQTWGELCLSDVSHFLVNCFAPLTQQQLTTLKQLKIPVHECKPYYRANRPHYPSTLYPGKEL